MATIAVIGATGGIGRHVVEQALTAGHRVQALARTPSKISSRSGLTVTKGSVTDAQAVAKVVLGADIVLSCLGTTRGQAPVVTVGTQQIVDCMKVAGVERFAMISSVGVGSSEAQGKRVSRFFMYVIVPLVLGQRFYELADAELAARTLPKAVIVRPTGLSNRAGTGRYHAVSSDSRETSLQIPRADVAAFLVSLVDDTSHDGTAVSVFAT